jgi:hypothetical protein
MAYIPFWLSRFKNIEQGQLSYPKICPSIVQDIFQGHSDSFYGTDLKGTKAQLTNGPIQKMAQTGLFATRSPSERSLHARLAKQTFATSSPSEADRQQKISGFVLSPLGHEKEHYKYQHFSNEKGRTKKDERRTLASKPSRSQTENPGG